MNHDGLSAPRDPMSPTQRWQAPTSGNARATIDDRSPLCGIVVYVDRPRYLIHQAGALFESLAYSSPPRTRLICFGPAEALRELPDDPALQKIEQAPHRLAPVYPFINSLWCFVGPGSEALSRYDVLLKSDVDTFITPAWRVPDDTSFHCGRGAYVHTPEVQEKLLDLAQAWGCTHRGWHNLGSTLLGPRRDVVAVCDLACRITEGLLESEFHRSEGAWPGWFRGVSSMYATEVALNHLVPGLVRADLWLDVPSHEDASIHERPHIHCWHEKRHFSKHDWIDGLYPRQPESALDMSRIPDFCLAMSQRAADRLASRPQT